MTAEQIAELRRRCLGNDVGAAELVRVLDERESLLKALKDVQGEIEMGGGCDCKAKMIAAAIDKAEAP